MKVSMLAALESPGARAQQLARQMLVHGRALSLEEMMARIDAINVEDVRNTGASMLRSPPTSRRSAGSAGFPAKKVARSAERSLMALFRLSRSVSPEPLLRGDGLYLRPAIPADFSSWVRLRAASREFLTPWEPIWPEDDLTRAAFRRRLRRQDEDMARDEAFSFLIFDAGPERCWAA